MTWSGIRRSSSRPTAMAARRTCGEGPARVRSARRRAGRGRRRSWASRAGPSSSSTARSSWAARDRVVVVGAGLRVEVDAQFVGAVGVVAAHRPGVEGEAAEVGGPQRRRRVSVGQISSALRPLGKAMWAVGIQSGRFLGARFWKKDSPSTPSGIPLQGGGPVAQGAQDAVADGEVVLGDVQLGEAALREVHLVRAGQPYRPPARVQLHRIPAAPMCATVGRARQCAHRATGPDDRRRIEAWICR